MRTDTSDKILGYIQKNKQAKAVDLTRTIGIKNAAIHRQLNKLLEQRKLMKVGKPPLVFYILKDEQPQTIVPIPQEIQNFMNENYVYVSPVGEVLVGMEGFTKWVSSINQEKYMLPLAHEYLKVRKEANHLFSKEGWIDATQAKEQATFSDTALHKMLYKDFYSLEKFGKTKLGQMVLYAKISQNIKIIDSIVEHIKPLIGDIIQKYSIDTIAYIPPSVKRQVQLMTELRNRLQLRLPEISLIKAYAGDIIVSQKSLSKFQERVINAQDTIFVDVHKLTSSPKNVLIIDDAVGSGATLHETAKKIRTLINPKGHILGFAIVGSMKGFEVIREI